MAIEVTPKYDSTEDTKKHIERVRFYLTRSASKLHTRGIEHDKSKLESPEKEAFDIATPQLKGLTYGSPEYKAATARLGDALKHHYSVNSHHPEHYKNGLDGGSLFDWLEMLCDWKAASERHADGDIWKSLEINRERFGMSEQLYNILKNTMVELGW